MKDALRSEWEKIHAGPRNGHRVASPGFRAGLPSRSASSNQEAQFVESKEVSVRDIARYFGVPLYKLGEGKERTAPTSKTPLSTWWVPCTPL